MNSVRPPAAALSNVQCAAAEFDSLGAADFAMNGIVPPAVPPCRPANSSVRPGQLEQEIPLHFTPARR